MLSFTTRGKYLAVDYRLNPFELFLENIQFERIPLSCSSYLLLSINQLLLTPASIKMYCRLGTRGSVHSSNTSRLMQLHLESASSAPATRTWVSCTDPLIKRWTRLEHLWNTERPKLDILGVEWQYVLRYRDSNFYIAILYKYRDRSTTSSDSDLDFSEDEEGKTYYQARSRDLQRCSGIYCHEVGEYRTTCAPIRMMVYYALVEIIT